MYWKNLMDLSNPFGSGIFRDNCNAVNRVLLNYLRRMVKASLNMEFLPLTYLKAWLDHDFIYCRCHKDMAN